MSKLTVGFAMTGSFCMFEIAIKQMEKLVEIGYNIIPIMSFNAFNLDTKFGKAADFRNRVEEICGRKIINSIPDAEPIGPQKLTDVMLIAPCTGNTLAKLCRAVTDTSVTMAAKAHLRTQRPLVLALATNDALGASAQNLGRALNTKNVYFVPLRQDDPENKPTSLVCDFEKISETLTAALENKQIQPIFV